ncbi:MAG TPA: MYXO-CTERM sorting domain-containing protein [Myxococcota bacterium]|nr:MYXO-CTERM sorting domain-containing protein [Myxococcota bacterium]HRY96991.1 MYXO-CTERM sorting domain-containing protein [Myxococcota bacterium]HSA23678.1 MYXO-CTERM sorting domain-containing protein [Myxococcota bacterium]
MRGFGILALVALALFLCPGAQAVGDAGIGPCWSECCFGTSNLNRAVAQAEVTAVRAQGVSIRLLETPIYCEGGVSCSPSDFPAELAWGGGSCPLQCGECEQLAVGTIGFFLLEEPTGCLHRVLPVNAEEVGCGRYDSDVPIAFALEQALRGPAVCDETYRQAGYLDECGTGDDDQDGCAQAGLSGGIVLVVLVLGLGWFAHRRRGAC